MPWDQRRNNVRKSGLESLPGAPCGGEATLFNGAPSGKYKYQGVEWIGHDSVMGAEKAQVMAFATRAHFWAQKASCYGCRNRRRHWPTACLLHAPSTSSRFRPS